ncbi:hypothetical protein [Rheinheimera sp. MM224]|uniref:hypothetical protein n=1 Tax=Rheinheimera sp. MM224 TaxID=3019969 RepID=UPI0021F81949|nr:hypothetical protein [Rheinheimera sp. MM224]CAI3805444.1 hypothetical protein JAMGFMIE_03874 [Rheinheimera sp. MM224]
MSQESEQTKQKNVYSPEGFSPKPQAQRPADFVAIGGHQPAQKSTKPKNPPKGK